MDQKDESKPTPIKRGRKQKYTSLKQTLEPRMMFDASLVIPPQDPGVTADTASQDSGGNSPAPAKTETGPHISADSPAPPPAPVVHSNATEDKSTPLEKITTDTKSATAAVSQESPYNPEKNVEETKFAEFNSFVPPTKEIVFIDARLKGTDNLLSDISSNAKVYFIDGSSDGVNQMTAIIQSQNSPISAVHILSHGDSGAIEMGDSLIDKTSLANQYKDAFASWSSHLSSDANVLLYGCNIAEGSPGKQFINDLSSTIGVAIGASSNTTGAEMVGGDWTFEYQTGVISYSAESVFSQRALSEFNYVFVLTVNEAPSGTDITINMARNNNYIFRVSDFGFSDSRDAIKAVQITTLPTGGTLALSGTAVAENSFISVADIDAGKLVYTSPGSAVNRTILFKVQDTGGTSNGGVDLDPAANTITLNIKGNNSAPVLTSTAPILTTITEDDIGNSGQVISSFLGVTDSKSTALKGIAITSVPSAVNGNWQYSLDSGATWTNFPSVSSSASLLLRDSDRVRFLPNAINGGTSTFTFRAWDQTSGDVGTTVSTTSNGGKNAFSNTAGTATINVVSVNDAPVLTGTSTVSYSENAAATLINPNITINDVDTANLESATVTITNFVAGQDVLSFTGNANTGNITASFNSNTGVLTLSSPNNSGTVAQFEAALKAVKYSNTSENPTTSARDITFVVNDGGSANALSNAIHSTVNITSVNDVPVLAGTSTVSYSENAAATLINPNITINDVDTANLESATITITNFVAGQDVLSFTGNANTGNITASFNSNTGVLTLSSPNNSGTVAQFEAALKAVKYSNTSENPTTSARDITFVVNDGSGANALSNAIHSTVNITSVNDAPVLTGTSTVSYSENADATVINSDITISDVDTASLASATITITNFVAGQDVLSFTGNANTGNITAAFNSNTGVLTLSSPNNSGTVAQFEAALKAVKYSNTSENPTTSARDITFVVNDGSGANALSNAIHSTVNITSVNDAPVLTGTSTVSYSENADATVINSDITINDVDTANLESATVTITNFVAGQDVLSFTGNANTGNITAAFNSNTGVLTLSSPNNSGTVAQFEAALKAVKYSNTSENPTTSARDITFVVNDGSGANALSNAIHSTVEITAINNAPILKGTSTIVVFTENGRPRIINSSISIADVDTVNLTFASVTIANYVTGQDLLTFTPNVNTGNITGNFDSNTGTLTLTSANNTATIPQFEAAIGSVRYSNTVTNPNTTNRDIIFSVNDSASKISTSNVIHSTVKISTRPVVPTVPTIIIPITSQFSGQESPVTKSSEVTNYLVSRPNLITAISTAPQPQIAYALKSDYDFNIGQINLKPNLTELSSIYNSLQNIKFTPNGTDGSLFTFKPDNLLMDFQENFTKENNSITKSSSEYTISTDEKLATETTDNTKQTEDKEIAYRDKDSVTAGKRESFQKRVASLLKDFGILPNDKKSG